MEDSCYYLRSLCQCHYPLVCVSLLGLAVWHSGSMLVSINEVTLCQTRLILGGWPVQSLTPSAGNLSQYITSHPGQLSLAIPLWVGAVSTSQRAVMLYGWGVKAGMVRLWVAGKTVWSRCYHGPYLSALEMRFMIKRCTNWRHFFTLPVWSPAIC